MGPRSQAAWLALALGACSSTSITGSGGGSTGGGDEGRSGWLGRDAGSCTDDSQCPSGDYCDFWSFDACVWDGGVALANDGGLPWGPFGRAVGGTCFPRGAGQEGSPCESDEDCIPIFACHASATSEVDCTLQAPCSGGGVCWILGTPGPPDCPLGDECREEAAPHLRSGSYCDCPNLTCGER